MHRAVPGGLAVFVLILVLAIYIFVPGTQTNPKTCIIDEDCIVFGETGDCNCGCFNRNHLLWTRGGACFCLAPTSCECVNWKCEGIFG